MPIDKEVNQIQSITVQPQQNSLVSSEWDEMPKFLQALAALSTERRYGHALKIWMISYLCEIYLKRIWRI